MGSLGNYRTKGRGSGMYIFSRSARLGAGDVREQMAWAVSATEKVNQISEVPFRLWTRVFSAGLGTLVWATSVESLSQLEALDDKLMADDAYLDLVAQAAKYSSGEAINDGLVQIIHSEGQPDLDLTRYVTITTAAAAPGQIAQAAVVGVELCQKGYELTGAPTAFGASLTGPYGTFGWIGSAQSIEELERANQALADPAFVGLVDEKASQCFVSGSADQHILRRVV